MNQYTVVVIASTTKFYEALKHQLNRDNVLVERLSTCHCDQAYFRNDCPHMVVLLSNTQHVNELNICRTIKEHYKGLFLVITEPENMEFQLLALNLGVDASFTIGDGAQLIAANIKALLKRFIPETSLRCLQFGDLRIDQRKRDAYLLDKPVSLSTIEFALLWVLACQAGSVVTREEIHMDIYHEMYNGYDRNIDLYISRIRQKIGDDPYFPRYLKTVRGVGYQFVDSR